MSDEEVILKWNAEEGQLFGEDPETNEKTPIDFEQLRIGGDGPIEGIEDDVLDEENNITGTSGGSNFKYAGIVGDGYVYDSDDPVPGVVFLEGESGFDDNIEITLSDEIAEDGNTIMISDSGTYGSEDRVINYIISSESEQIGTVTNSSDSIEIEGGKQVIVTYDSSVGRWIVTPERATPEGSLVTDEGSTILIGDQAQSFADTSGFEDVIVIGSGVVSEGDSILIGDVNQSRFNLNDGVDGPGILIGLDSDPSIFMDDNGNLHIPGNIVEEDDDLTAPEDVSS